MSSYFQEFERQIKEEKSEVKKLRAEIERLRAYLFEIQRDVMLSKEKVLEIREFLGLDEHGRVRKA